METIPRNFMNRKHIPKVFISMLCAPHPSVINGMQNVGQRTKILQEGVLHIGYTFDERQIEIVIILGDASKFWDQYPVVIVRISSSDFSIWCMSMDEQCICSFFNSTEAHSYEPSYP